MVLSFENPCCVECYRVARRALNKRSVHGKVKVWLGHLNDCEVMAQNRASREGTQVCATCKRVMRQLSYKQYRTLITQKSSQDE
jgi:hypothetical protein